MINVTRRKCQGSGCTRQSTFANEGERAKFCSSHREEGMVDVKNVRCKSSGCMTHPTFGFVDDRPSVCATHKQPGMIDVMNRRCMHLKCGKKPRYGHERVSTRPMFCESHKEEGMVVLVKTRAKRSLNGKQVGGRGEDAAPSDARVVPESMRLTPATHVDVLDTEGVAIAEQTPVSLPSHRCKTTKVLSILTESKDNTADLRQQSSTVPSTFMEGSVVESGVRGSPDQGGQGMRHTSDVAAVVPALVTAVVSREGEGVLPVSSGGQGKLSRRADAVTVSAELGTIAGGRDGIGEIGMSTGQLQKPITEQHHAMLSNPPHPSDRTETRITRQNASTRDEVNVREEAANVVNDLISAVTVPPLKYVLPNDPRGEAMPPRIQGGTITGCCTFSPQSGMDPHVSTVVDEVTLLPMMRKQEHEKTKEHHIPRVPLRRRFQANIKPLVDTIGQVGNQRPEATEGQAVPSAKALTNQWPLLMDVSQRPREAAALELPRSQSNLAAPRAQTPSSVFDSRGHDVAEELQEVVAGDEERDTCHPPTTPSPVGGEQGLDPSMVSPEMTRSIGGARNLESSLAGSCRGAHETYARSVEFTEGSFLGVDTLNLMPLAVPDENRSRTTSNPDHRGVHVATRYSGRACGERLARQKPNELAQQNMSSVHSPDQLVPQERPTLPTIAADENSDTNDNRVRGSAHREKLLHIVKGDNERIPDERVLVGQPTTQGRSKANILSLRNGEGGSRGSVHEKAM